MTDSKLSPDWVDRLRRDRSSRSVLADSLLELKDPRAVLARLERLELAKNAISPALLIKLKARS